jgi:CRP-like cAMP-binding protein
LDYIYCQMSYSGLAWVMKPSLHNIQQLLLVTCVQVELLGGFLSSAHLLRNLQPTNIKDLAQTMLGRACSDGELIYRQGDAANNFYIVLRGEVVMYETDAHTATSSGLTLGSQQQQQQQQQQRTQSGASRGSSASGGKSQHGAKSSAGGAPHSSSPRVKTAAGNASATASIDVIEVRRIGPREAFGEDDISAGSKCEQSAVAGNTSNHSATLALIAAGAGPAGAAAAGTQAAAASSSSVSSTPRSPMDGSSSSNTRALLDARRRTMGHKESATGAAAAPAGTVLLQLSADDYGAALEGRLSAMLEQKVGTAAVHMQAHGHVLMSQQQCAEYCTSAGAAATSAAVCNLKAL